MTITVYQCPTVRMCPWEGTRHEIVAHFRTAHPDLLLESDTFHLRLDLSEINYLMCPAQPTSRLTIPDELFLIQVRFAEGQLRIQVRFTGVESHLRTMSYRIRLEVPPCASSIPHKIDAPTSSVNVDLARCGWLATMDIVCRIVMEASTIKESPAIVRVPMAALRRKCSSKWSKAKLQLARTESTRSSHFYVDDFDDDPDAHSLLRIADARISLLKDYKCAKCLEYIAGPIYRCTRSHSICYPCWLPWVRTCPAVDCDGRVDEGGRDQMLERTRDLTTLPCRFTGCGQLVIGGRLQEHQVQCSRCVYVCPECLHLIGRYADVEKHFRIVHPSVKRVGTLETPFAHHDSFLVMHHLGVFHCRRRASEPGTVEWHVEQCGHFAFYFEADVLLKSHKANQPTNTYTLNRNDAMTRASKCVSLGATKASRLRNAVLRITLYNSGV